MFHSIIEELFSLADLLGAAAEGFENAAKRLDKKILDLAIRGKRVPQDPSDEPASELVERIAASHKLPYGLLFPFRNDIVAIMPNPSIAIIPQM